METPAAKPRLAGELGDLGRVPPPVPKDCSMSELMSERRLVWSLTQVYPVDFSKSRIVGKKCVFNKRTKSRFASVVVDGVLRPPCLAQHN